jgi:hypothetical protein
MCGVLQKYSADQNTRSHTVLHTVLLRFGRALPTALSRFRTPFQETKTSGEWVFGSNFFLKMLVMSRAKVGPSNSSCVVVDHRRSSSTTAVSEKIGRSSGTRF